VDAASIQVNEGTRTVGDVIVEHDAYLKRTGVVKEAIAMKNAYGTDILIPEGTKAFAVNFTLVSGYQRVRQRIDPIEWCVYLPKGINGRRDGAETVCAFWESEQRARYDQDFQVGGFAFLPSLYSPAGMPGVVPKIQEEPVDFGVRFKHQIRVAKMTDKAVTLETFFSDGTHSKRRDSDTYEWKSDGTLTQLVGDSSVLLKATPDRKSVQVSRLGGPNSGTGQEVTVLLDLLVGIDGTVKDARVAKSSGSPQVDEAALTQARTKMKFEPGSENGKPVEKWSKVSITFKLEE
jgi:TonB family protein